MKRLSTPMLYIQISFLNCHWQRTSCLSCTIQCLVDTLDIPSRGGGAIPNLFWPGCFYMPYAIRKLKIFFQDRIFTFYPCYQGSEKLQKAIRSQTRLTESFKMRQYLSTVLLWCWAVVSFLLRCQAAGLISCWAAAAALFFLVSW